jgi:hypothetical protein
MHHGSPLLLSSLRISIISGKDTQVNANAGGVRSMKPQV